MSVYQGGGCVASASNARLYFEDDQDRKQIRACCASSRDLQWIKVDLERVKQITAVVTQGNTVIVSRGSLQRERENIRILRGHYFQKYRMSLSTVCFFLWRHSLLRWRLMGVGKQLSSLFWRWWQQQTNWQLVCSGSEPVVAKNRLKTNEDHYWNRYTRWDRLRRSA